MLHLVYRRAQQRRFLQIGFGLLQCGLKLRQRRRKGSGLHHDLRGGEALRIDFSQDCVIDGRGGECRVARHRSAVANGAGMKIPARIFLDAVDDVLLVKDQTVIRIGVASDMIGMEDFRITKASSLRC